jgi:hypothetical protein
MFILDGKDATTPGLDIFDGGSILEQVDYPSFNGGDCFTETGPEAVMFMPEMIYIRSFLFDGGVASIVGDLLFDGGVASNPIADPFFNAGEFVQGQLHDTILAAMKKTNYNLANLLSVFDYMQSRVTNLRAIWGTVFAFDGEGAEVPGELLFDGDVASNPIATFYYDAGFVTSRDM